MSTDILHPEEWPDLVKAVQAGDPGIGQRLSERERRFDNFFASGSYKPTATQGAALTASTVAYETYGWWFRLGDLVWVQACFRSTSAGTLANRILISVPPELLIASPDRQPGNSVVDIDIPRGGFVWVDDSTTPDGTMHGNAVSYANTHIAGRTSGLQAAAETFIYIGEGAANQIAAGDWIKMNVCYLTSAQALV